MYSHARSWRGFLRYCHDHGMESVDNDKNGEAVNALKEAGCQLDGAQD